MRVKERELMARKMVLHPDKCSGCMLCMMACSSKYEGMVNPLKARTKIITNGDKVKRVVLTKDCTFCGYCVTVCHYSARELEPKEVA